MYFKQGMIDTNWGSKPLKNTSLQIIYVAFAGGSASLGFMTYIRLSANVLTFHVAFYFTFV